MDQTTPEQMSLQSEAWIAKKAYGFLSSKKGILTFENERLRFVPEGDEQPIFDASFSEVNPKFPGWGLGTMMTVVVNKKKWYVSFMPPGYDGSADSTAEAAGSAVEALGRNKRVYGTAKPWKELIKARS
jgi:hypothetical protein